MNLTEFVDRYDGKHVDYDGVYGYQCVDLVRQYIKEVLDIPQPPPVPEGAWAAWEKWYDTRYFTSLPDNLSVGGSLFLSGTAIPDSAVPSHLLPKVIR